MSLRRHPTEGPLAHRLGSRTDREAARFVEAARTLDGPMGSNDREYPNIFEQYLEGDDRGVLLLDSRRQVLALNPAAHEILGFAGQVPTTVNEIVSDIHLGFAVGDAIHDRRTVQHETVLPDPDRILRFTIIPIRSREGYTDHAVVTVHDITRLRHLETVRRDFVANVSHELRTPIASINLLVETLQAGGMSDPEAAAHFLRRIAVETQSMARLVEELLQLSRLESGRLSLNMEAVDIAGLIDEVRSRLAMMANEKRIEMSADVQADLPAISADPAALEQVLMNLVHNAIKFTPEDGAVIIRARRHGPGVEVEVADTGVGMNAAEAARIFERFYKVDQARSRAEGTGLGLAIARHVLELHGSRLQVVSEPGRGSRFGFSLPMAE